MSIRTKTELALAVTAVLALGACEVERTEEGSMPEVDVQADAGNLPEYEVTKKRDGNMPSVDVDVEGGNLPKYDVDAPDVDVDMEEKTIRVPDVDVDMPDDEDDLDNN